MAIEFACPACGGTLRVEDDAVGQVVRCGGCMTMLRVPDDAPSASNLPSKPENSFPGAEPLPSKSVRSSTRRSNDEPVPSDRPTGEQPKTTRRRRTRREPSLPQGRSPTFWVIITLGTLGIALSFFCCGLVALIPGTDWNTHESSSGGFQVDLPASAKSSMSLPNLKLDPSLKIEGTRLLNNGEDYAVLYKDIVPTDKREKSDKQLLDQQVLELKTALGIRRDVESRAIEEYGFPAREIKFPVGEGAYVLRFIVADSRLYILVVGSRMGHPDEENLQRFFNSFRITDERLLAVQKDRLERGQVGLFGKALGEDLMQTIEAGVEQAEIAKLGSLLARAPLDAVVARLELTRATTLGTALAQVPVQAIRAELERRQQERLAIAKLGSALVQAPYKTIVAEQNRIAEQNRSYDIGLAVAKAVTTAIQSELTKSKERR